VDQRQANQAQRIEQGKASGELTRREAHRLNRQQKGVAAAESQAKADGTVTAQERKRLHNMQDHTSQNIRQQKHDRQSRPASAPAAGK
jgi:tellurite resistance protein